MDVSPLGGKTNLLDGIAEVARIRPIMVGLQDPSMICWPLVRGTPFWVRQKLMKLLDDVKEGTCPATKGVQAEQPYILRKDHTFLDILAVIFQSSLNLGWVQC